MSDDTTLLLFTQNNQDIIKKTLSVLEVYMNKYRNVKEVLICDDNSIDRTVNIASSFVKNNVNIRIIVNGEMLYNKLVAKAFDYVRTPLTIIIEPELYTRLHQIQRQIKKLYKADMVLTNRFDVKSRVFFANKQTELKMKSYNYFLQTMTGFDYQDMANINKGFKTFKVKDLMKKCRSNKYFWQELIARAKKIDLRITQQPTHYIEKKKVLKGGLMDFVSNVMELRRIARI